MGKEIRITLNETLELVSRVVDVKYDLPKDKWSIHDREEFIKQVYYTYLREVKANNKLYLNYINSALHGNLAHWYSDTLSYEKKAPFIYREDVIKFIDCLFRESYEVVE